MSIETMKQVLEVLNNNRRKHYSCEDNWYSCPKDEDGCANDQAGDDCTCGADKSNVEIDAAIAALQEAIAEAEKQEPVAWAGFNERGECREMLTRDVRKNIPYYPTEGMTPLYITPPKRTWVGLTEEEIDSVNCVEKLYIGEGDSVVDPETVHEFARFIEAKLRELNT